MFVILCLDIIVITIKPLYNIILLRLKSIVAIFLFLYVVILGAYLLSSYSHLVSSWSGAGRTFKTRLK
jgi:hypothetical protein